jgi:hypothetical protein
VQVPRALLPLTGGEVKELAEHCYLAGRAWSYDGYESFTVYAGEPSLNYLWNDSRFIDVCK